MMAKTHIALGVVATITLSAVTGERLEPLQWFAVIVGCLAPDIDHTNAVITRPGSLFGRALPRTMRQLLNIFGILLSRVINKIFGHRNALHWPSLGLATIALGLFLEWDLLAWFGWGYLWHILGDFCTRGGIPFWGPFSRRPVQWSPLRTGSWQETMLCFFLWGIVVWCGWEHLPPRVKKNVEKGIEWLRESKF